MTALARFRTLEGKVQFFRDHMISDLQQSNPAIYAKLSAFTAPQKGSFIDLALSYDLATNLADKTPLSPVLVSPTERLSGSGLYAFGGFLVDRLRERDYAQGVYDAYQAWKVVAETQRDFSLDPNSAPDQPPSAAELFPQCQDEYKKGIERLAQRVDRVIGALSSGATGGGLVGGVEAAALRLALDAIANHYLRKAGSGP
jgi:hypothetical protein